MTMWTPSDDELYAELGKRIGVPHLRRRLGIERDGDSWIERSNPLRMHLENFYSAHSIIRSLLRCAFLLRIARDNALQIQLRLNDLEIARLPSAFNGYRVLHLSDLHLDMNDEFPNVLSRRVHGIDYDLCVITGDFRYETFGSIEPALAGMRLVRDCLKDPVYGILGNHDSIRMVPPLERMGVKMLINEAVEISRKSETIYLAGIDDPHFFRAHNFDAACKHIDDSCASVLLSHSPEVYAQAAHSGFSAMLCGHTHGGQICLPGGYPIITDADCPRRYARGSWKYNDMPGYTSVGAGSSIVDVRLNCYPEVTLHTLRCAH